MTKKSYRPGDYLLDSWGTRKYLTKVERETVLRSIIVKDTPDVTLCLTLLLAGCRLSEALAMTADHVDLQRREMIFATAIKHRSVPVPPALLSALERVHGIRARQEEADGGQGLRLWPWSRMTGWRAVHRTLMHIGYIGPYATPKGLRHSFAVAAVDAGIPVNFVQKWLGHAQISTTAVYVEGLRFEPDLPDREIASWMWTTAVGGYKN